jgi:hypothetical protein
MADISTVEAPSLEGVMNRLQEQIIVHTPSVLKTDQQSVDEANASALLEKNNTETQDTLEDTSNNSKSKEKGIQPPQFAIGTAGHKIILNALTGYINEPEIKSFADMNGKIFDQLKTQSVYDTDIDEFVPGPYVYEKIYNTFCIAASRVHKEMRDRIPQGYKAFVMTEVPISGSKEQKEQIDLLKKDIQNKVFTPDQILDLQKKGKFITKDGTEITEYQLMKAVFEQKQYLQILKQHDAGKSSTPIPDFVWPYDEVSYDDAKKLVSVLGMTIEKVGEGLNFTYSNEARLDSWIFYYKENDTFALEQLQKLQQVKSKAYFHGSLLDFMNENSQSPVIKQIWNNLRDQKLRLDVLELKIHPDKDTKKYETQVKNPEDTVSVEHKKHAAHQLKAIEQLIHAHHSDEILFPFIWQGVKDNIKVLHQDIYIPMLYPEEHSNMKKPPYNFGVPKHVLLDKPVELDVGDLIENYQDDASAVAKRHGYI